ncbi:RNase P/RNase MRP subunit p29 [Virgibacillus halotolerans]|uniref:hypothetical protein n=1 Tax=Virgibacillus halotolerans TaxID=1071053 RepID=UPI001961ECBB|nr:hypothetical protein [Virgibacillus halotolerans]MBM7598274.1 RNase P/RNase MRP subunit p29 [Virgibacillus halotolerans]
MSYRRPMMGEYVNVVDNETMHSVGKGKLIHFTREQIVIVHLNRGYKMMFDARVNHFEGYEPPVMLIKKKEN